MIVMMWNIKFSSVFVLWHRILHCCWAELEITKFDPYLYHSLKIGLTYDQYTHRRISTVHPSWRDNWINRNSNVQIRKKTNQRKHGTCVSPLIIIIRKWLNLEENVSK